MENSEYLHDNKIYWTRWKLNESFRRLNSDRFLNEHRDLMNPTEFGKFQLAADWDSEQSPASEMWINAQCPARTGSEWKFGITKMHEKWLNIKTKDPWIIFVTIWAYRRIIESRTEQWTLNLGLNRNLEKSLPKEVMKLRRVWMIVGFMKIVEMTFTEGLRKVGAFPERENNIDLSKYIWIYLVEM